MTAHSRAFYLGANTSTERKNLERFQAVATRRGIQLDASLVDTTEAWLAAFHRAQQYDFIALGSNSGINDWQDTTVLASIGKSGRRLTLTNHEWMMPFAMLGLTKVPEEQGEWAAKIALQILQGVAPSSIPIVPNRKWDIWMNPLLVETAGIALPKPPCRKRRRSISYAIAGETAVFSRGEGIVFGMVSILLCVVSVLLTVRFAISRAERDFMQRAASVYEDLTQRLGSLEAVLVALAGLHHASDDLSQAQFSTFAQELLGAYPYIGSILFLPKRHRKISTYFASPCVIVGSPHLRSQNVTPLGS